MQRCSKCKKLLDESEFSKCKVFKDGLQYICKACNKDYYQDYYRNNREQLKKYQKEYHQNNREQLKKYQKEYNQNNREQIKEYNQDYYQDPIHQLKHTWHSMINRCTNPKHKDYKYYGGRGISVCSRWMDSFETFKNGVGVRPGPEYSIDRIDNNSDYKPGNCKWSTAKEQANNRRLKRKRRK